MKMTPRILLLAILIVAAGSPATLEAGIYSGQISGKIKSMDGTSLVGAVVSIFKQSRQGGTISFTRSDQGGVYTIANLMPGSYYLQVSREGYQPLTQSSVRIESGKTATFDIILQEILDVLSADNDSRNWDLKTLVRSTNDRRLIFRYKHGANSPYFASAGAIGTEVPQDQPMFARAAAFSVASSSALNSESYLLYPVGGRNGIVSNFAFIEPVGDHGRMIFAGQLNSGSDTLWKVKNTYNYRPNPDRDFNFSLGYSRINRNTPASVNGYRPTQFFSQDPMMRDAGIQTVGIELGARTRVSNAISVDYGLDYSRVTYGTTHGMVSPAIQLVFTPTDTWTFRARTGSRRVTDSNTVILPDGDVVNLSESSSLTQIDGEIRLSQIKHSEFSLEKLVMDATSIGLAVYSDRMNGPGTPILLTTSYGGRQHTQLAQLREDQASQRGLRLTVNRKFLDYLNGSIAYVYGTGTSLTDPDEALTSEALARDFLNFVARSYYHSITSQVDATLPLTKTRLTTVLRWYPGSTLTPIDLFYDRRDTLSKGVSIFLRQTIPLPEFMSPAGRWEALVDVRNLFDQGKDRVHANDGDLILSRSPRTFRFGLNLNFY